MKRKTSLISALTVLLLSSCGETPLTSSESSSESKTDISSISSKSSIGSLSSSSKSSETSLPPESIVTGTDVLASGNQEAFFNSGSGIAISLKFSNSALYDLSRYGGNVTRYNHKYDDVYFPATFTAKVGETTYTYYDVGVRMKGATSRREISSSDGTINNSCHLKINFKATFDDFLYDLDLFSRYKHSWTDAEKTARKDRRFFGMEKLDLKYLPRNESAINGETYSQEIYSYNLFRENDVPTSYARWVDLNLSNDKETKSFHYEAIEPIDKRFLKRAFNDNKGDLYKCTQVIDSSLPGNPLDTTKYADLSLNGAVRTNSFDENGYANGARVANGLIGVEDNYNNYHPVYNLKTNDDNGEQSDFSKMANLINVCYSLRYKKAPYSLLEQTIDVDEWLKFSAISYILGDYDDMRNNSNNYYIYFRKSDRKAVFIPYDYDYSLGLVKSNQNYTIMTERSPFTTTVSHGKTSQNNLFYSTIFKNENLSYYSQGTVTQTTLRTTYKSYIDTAVTAGALDFVNYETMLASLPNSVTSETKEKQLVRQYMTKKKTTIENTTVVA